MNEVFVSILVIGFLALATVAIVLLAAFTYVEVQYYHWNKEERANTKLVDKLSEKITEKMKDEISGGN